MSISPVSNLGMPPAGAVTGPAAVTTPHQALPVTVLLGMSPDEIARQLRSGKSLEDIARSKNVSHADLVAALKANGPRELKIGQSSDHVTDRPAVKPPESAPTTQELPTRGTHRGDGVGRATGPRTHDAADKDDRAGSLGLQGPAQKNRPGSPGKDPRDVDAAHPRDGAGLEALIKRAGIDPTALGGGMPKGLIVDTTA